MLMRSWFFRYTARCSRARGRQLNLFRRQQLAVQSADALQHVHGGIMVLRGQLARQHDVPVQDRADRVGHRVVHVVRLHQHGEQAGDGALLAGAGPLEQLREQRENRGV